MRAECPHVWQAEALEDGRLDGADRAAFARHSGACAACRREIAQLASLRAVMGTLDPPKLSPLERHRLRASLLREANRTVVRAHRHRARWVAAFAAVLVLAALGTATWKLRRADAPVVTSATPAAAAVPDFHVQARDAVWKTRSEGPQTALELSQGEASFEVSHLSPSQRFVVVLPDGEVEVRGTRFTVDVDDGRTRRIVVDEGRVVFRRIGEAEAVLAAGDRWPPVALSARDGDDAGAPEQARVERQRGVTSTAPPAPVSPGERFEQAMQSFGAAKYAQADAELAAFQRAFPGDARSEDASFLRAVARSRIGDRQGAAALARVYLRAYPSGLRRLEAQRLADEGSRR